MNKSARSILHLFIRLSIVLALLCLMVTAAISNTSSVSADNYTIPINMIFYGWHDSTVDQAIINAHPEFLVDNSPVGPWKGNASISKFTAAGIKYFEYIDGGYEGTVNRSIPNDLASNLKYIEAAAQAGAYGIFLDEVSAYPSSSGLSYLQQIADKAHSLGLKVVFNTGVDNWDDRLMNYCDYLNSSETWNIKPLTSSQQKWANRTWFLTYNINDATTAANITRAAWNYGIRASYVCVNYTSLPNWLNEYVSLLQTSVPTTTSIPTPSSSPFPSPSPSPSPTPTPTPTSSVSPTPTPSPTPSPANRAPVISPIGNKTVIEGTLLSFTVAASDPDGDPLKYSASNLPAGATFNASTHIFSWQPSYTQAGTYSNIVFSVSDGQLNSSVSISITVVNVNRSPVLNPIGDKSVTAGSALTFTISASDPDGDKLTYTASGLPSGASFDPSMQIFLWQPAANQTGIYSEIRFIVSDGTLTDSETITISVNAPTVTSYSISSGSGGSTGTFVLKQKKNRRLSWRN